MTTIINGSSDINLDFSTGGRITGDFSNATQANRVLFQSTTANGNTSVQCVPNGTATTSGFGAFNSSDPANAGRWYINATSSLVNMSADKTGTGSYLPMTFNTGGSETLRLSETSKAVILSGGSTSANGTGITFPATQSASSNANTLDDYEEGSWTPTDASGAGLTFSAAYGYYIKVGKMVYVQAKIIYPSTGSSALNSLGGLPFAMNNSNPYNFPVGACSANGNTNALRAYGVGSTFAFLNTSDVTTTNASLSGANINFNFTYIADQ